MKTISACLFSINEGVVRPAPFRIGRDIYDEPFYTVTRGMYLWSCGIVKRCV